MALYARINEYGFLETPYRKLEKVVRGGAWNCVPFICRSTHADIRGPDSTYKEQGFRVARDP